MVLEFINRLLTHGVLGSYMVLHVSSESEILALRDALEPLTNSGSARLEIHKLSFVSCIDNCQLHAASARQDSGVLFRNAPRAMTLVLSPTSWIGARETLALLATGQIEAEVVHLNSTKYGPRVVCTRGGRDIAAPILLQRFDRGSSVREPSIIDRIRRILRRKP